MHNFTSLLYWLGITTITGQKFGKTKFGIPNETLKELAAKMVPAAYADVHKIDERVFEINSSVDLHRLVLVFHGGDRVLADEV